MRFSPGNEFRGSRSPARFLERPDSLIASSESPTLGDSITGVAQVCADRIPDGFLQKLIAS